MSTIMSLPIYYVSDYDLGTINISINDKNQILVYIHFIHF